ncbi:MAG TPA: hypothetical protein VNK96_09730 [Fimbriimonadales bacterium]|nr:hypothetical protein [Fimbriimonadales bacterium]
MRKENEKFLIDIKDAFADVIESFSMSDPIIRFEDEMGVSVELKNQTSGILIGKQEFEGFGVFICKLVDGQIIIPFGAITEQSDVYIVPIETIAELRGGRYKGPKIDAFSIHKDQPLILREYARMVKNYAHDFLSGDFSEWEYVLSEYKKRMAALHEEAHTPNKPRLSVPCLVIGVVIFVLFIMCNRSCHM